MDPEIPPMMGLDAMSRTQETLMRRARSQYGHIEPCRGKSFAECFLRQNGMLQFWFNDSTGNTRLLYVKEQPVLTLSR